MSPDSSYSSSTLTNGVSSGSTSLTLPNTSSSSSSSASGNNNVAGKKPADAGGGGGGGGMGAAPPRVDLEPIYEGLRAGLALEQWLKYKEGLSGFLLGEYIQFQLQTLLLFYEAWGLTTYPQAASTGKNSQLSSIPSSLALNSAYTINSSWASTPMPLHGSLPHMKSPLTFSLQTALVPPFPVGSVVPQKIPTTPEMPG